MWIVQSHLHFHLLQKNSHARALTKDMGRARKKKYVRANFELKQEKTAAMFLFENTNPSNICFFYRDVSKTFGKPYICGLVNVQ